MMRQTNFVSLPFFVAALLLLAAVPDSFGQEEAASGGGIRQMMTPEQFEAAGLGKLSPKELQNLNNWLQGYRETTEKTAQQKAVKSGKVIPTLVVSRIDGPFFGLTGSTIITLQDGTKWKQANKSDHYQGPGGDNLGVAVIKAGLFGYRMRIEGTPEFYVDRVSK